MNNKHYYYYYYFFLILTGAVYAAPPCERTCGDVDVPYPFGIGDPSCAKVDFSQEFLLHCHDMAGPNTSSISSSRSSSGRSGNYKLLLGENIEVLGISVDEATLSVNLGSTFKCYDEIAETSEQNITLDGPFTFSSAQNKLVTLGCDTLAFMQDDEGKFSSGCVSLCNEDVDLGKEGACSGLGCCETSLPKNVKNLEIGLESIYNHSGITDFNPCDFAMLVDQRTLNMSAMTLGFRPGDPAVEHVSTLLDWVVGNETCEESQTKLDYACGDNTFCSYSDNALGYRCHCIDGFRGNPYLRGQGGCQDIDECKEPQRYRCEGHCKNTIGSYDCNCPLGMRGDGKFSSCQGFRVTTLASVVGGSASVVAISMLIFYDCKRRKREKIFIKNGGLILKHQRVRIFTSNELAKATNNYNDTQLLGKGGFASVYKGVLITKDNTETLVAVKKPKDDDKIQINNQQFHEEIAIVSQVNHRNVVMLLGVCLETRTPLLVYEFVPKGTLYQHIHKQRSPILRLWKNRLKIAVETALALDYLHSLANPPIIHRDVKSSNILLDESYTAKVSDFGASVLIPPDHQTGIATTVQGTLGYLDPEYLNTGTLTTKSDVYSFGVVLLELVTGEKPISRGRTGNRSNIIQYFVSKVGEKRGSYIVGEVLDAEVVRDEDEAEQIQGVAELAARCLATTGAGRPSMREVAEELGRLSKLNGRYNNKAWRIMGQETEALLADLGCDRNRCFDEAMECSSNGGDSMASRSGFDSCKLNNLLELETEEIEHRVSKNV